MRTPKRPFDDCRRASSTGDGTDRRSGHGLPILAVALAVILCGPVLSAQPDPFSTQPDSFSSQRQHMVDDQVRKRGIEQSGLLRAMEAVPRHLFVPKVYEGEAYGDDPVEIAPGKTMSEAYVSALMISLLDLRGSEKVLEVGTGSGYDAALLSSMVDGEIYTIEIDEDLGDRARTTLSDLGYRNVKVRIGDGYNGWPENAPFDAILVTTAPPEIPEPLIEQLRVGGRMVIPVGSMLQELKVIQKTDDGIRTRKIDLVSLVRMTGEAARRDSGRDR